MKNKKILKMMGLFTMLAMAGIVTTMNVGATEGEVGEPIELEAKTAYGLTDKFDLNIHKLSVANMDAKKFENNGETKPTELTGDKVGGVQFTLYDVTSDYYAARKMDGNTTAKKTLEYLQSHLPTTVGKTSYGPATTAQGVTGETPDSNFGVAPFAEIPVYSGGKYACYMLLETSSEGVVFDTDSKTTKKVIVQKAEPLFILMPVYRTDNSHFGTTTNDDMNIWPKNETGGFDKDRVKEDADGTFTPEAFPDKTSYPVSKYDDDLAKDQPAFCYQIKSPIPFDFADLNSTGTAYKHTGYVIEDTLDNGLEMKEVKGFHTLTKTAAELYAQGFNVEFKITQDSKGNVTDISDLEGTVTYTETVDGEKQTRTIATFAPVLSGKDGDTNRWNKGIKVTFNFEATGTTAFDATHDAVFQNGLKKLAGETLVMDYYVKWGTGANYPAMNTELDNDATLTVDRNGTYKDNTDDESVITYDYRFLKVDTMTGLSLAGAKFNIYHKVPGTAAGEWTWDLLTFVKKSDGVWLAGDNGTASSDILTTADGEMWLQGLEGNGTTGDTGKAENGTNGTYAYVEVGVPTGYIPSGDTAPEANKVAQHEFTVQNTNYSGWGNGKLFGTGEGFTRDNILNFTAKGITGLDANDKEEIGNTELGELPMTGGKGIVFLVIAGIACGVLGFVIVKQVRKDKEELY
jgi:LPXTG-motif cell wall-anchored protein